MTRPAHISKRAWRRLNADAANRGAIILPSDEARLATDRQRASRDLEAHDAAFNAAIERSRIAGERCLNIIENELPAIRADLRLILADLNEGVR